MISKNISASESKQTLKNDDKEYFKEVNDNELMNLYKKLYQPFFQSQGNLKKY